MDDTGQKALLILGCQVDRFPGGALPTADAHSVMLELIETAAAAELIVIVAEWHPHDHITFSQTHELWAGEAFKAPWGEISLVPRHCVRGTEGAELMLPDMIVDRAALIARHGTDRQVDALSAFRDTAGRSTGVAEWLMARGTKTIRLAGLALQREIYATAVDALDLGLQVEILAGCCKGQAPEADRITLMDLMMRGATIIEAVVRDDEAISALPEGFDVNMIPDLWAT